MSVIPSVHGGGGIGFPAYITGGGSASSGVCREGVLPLEGGGGLPPEGVLPPDGGSASRGVGQTPLEIHVILRDTVNKRAVCILLECILVILCVCINLYRRGPWHLLF